MKKQVEFRSAEFSRGFEAGYSEGIRKAILLLQLISSNTANFEESILQNSEEAVQLRKIFTEM